MAAYIDLNPMRVGMVSDPAEYRWSGYGEAMAPTPDGHGDTRFNAWFSWATYDAEKPRRTGGGNATLTLLSGLQRTAHGLSRSPQNMSVVASGIGLSVPPELAPYLLRN